MTVDQAVAAFEQDLETWAEGQALADLAASSFFVKLAAIPVVGGFLSGGLSTIAGLVLSIALKYAIKYLDLAGYYVYKATVNNIQAGQYEDSVNANNQAVEAGDANGIAAAEAARKAAFSQLILSN